MAESATYTCRKCQVEFNTKAAATEHYGGKWHQFNLMRILKDLSPISEDMYNKSVSQSAFLSKGKNQTNVIPCKACKKSFNSQGSFETHQRSKKHKQNLVKKAAENVRRVKIQLEKDARKQALLSYAMVVTSSDDVEGDIKEGSYYCRACKEAFAAQKDYLKHAETQKHSNALKLLKIAEDRKKELDDQDKEDAAATAAAQAEADMEVDDEDSDGWEEVDEMEVGEDGSTKIVPTVNTCLLCGKRSKKVEDNLQHMERHHQFKIPHLQSADLDRLMPYLLQKVIVDRKCVECSKSFQSVKGVRKHMLDKPHLSIYFEGEYDDFFDLKKILAPLTLPYKPADDDNFVLALPDGTFLTHRDLRTYFKQDLKLLPTTRGLKRLTDGRRAVPGVSHLGRFSKSNSETNFLEVRKDAKKRARMLKEETRGRARERLQVGVKANKLQPHLRPQVINAG
ncbi:zinc finger protein 622 [Hyalella azteca]|uniref:Zinc finger protein 622 n=1 Tax=Hyalella azteca TaxID=294128 RepID=A0A8B7NZ68_HYAAZ|nr:zinc finger protein 622 [Hyalella azteca]